MRRLLPAALPAALLVLLVAAAAVSCSGGGGDGGTAEVAAEATAATDGSDGTTATAPAGPLAYAGHESELYAGDENWLCRPGLADSVCDRDLDTTVIEADGSSTVEPFEPAEDAPIDCFYVYPTVSRDDGLSADLDPGDEEVNVVVNQAARLAEVCDVFAPVYRQATLNAISGRVTGSSDEELVAAFTGAYADVLDAFQQYIAHDNEGRGFVLVGHSQGAGLLGQLIAEEIDDDPALRDHLVSARLLGSSVAVPPGETVDAAFDEVPLCTEDGQTGCVVSYASFRSTDPPPATSFFGRVRAGSEVLDEHPDAVAACTNPAALAGGAADLTPYFLTSNIEVAAGTDQLADAPVTTPFVSFPGLLTAECVSEDGFDYLEVTVNGDPADPRIDDIPGDLSPEWGLHLVDVNMAMGDLVDRVGEQAEAYTAGD